MNIFKNYFKIVNAHKFGILLYTAIFAFIAFINIQANPASPDSFVEKRAKIAFFDEAQNQLSQGLKSYLEEIGEIADLTMDQAEDALFINSIQAIIKVPKDYTIDCTIEYKAAPGATSDFIVQQKVNQYLKTVSIYQQTGFSIDESLSKAKHSLAQEADIEIYKSSLGNQNQRFSTAFFNGLNYVLVAQVIIVIGLVTRTFYEQTLLKRNQVASLSKLRFNLEIILGHVVMSLLIWLIYVLMSYFIFKDTIALDRWWLYVFNSFIFLLSTMALGYLMTRIFATPEAASGGSNVISLGTSFFSGAFVPQSMLPAATLAIGKLTPSFYYVRNNDELISNPNMQLMYQNWGILLGFTVLFLALAILIKPRAISKEQ